MIKHSFKVACASALFMGLIFGSCKSEDFELGKSLVDPHTSWGMLDDVTIKVSNLVAFDSVVTSSKEIGFCGIYRDPYIGKIQAQTYIEFNRTSDNVTDRYANFDSIMLVLRPNGNYYGDTVAYKESGYNNASFKIFALTERIDKGDEGNLYSTSSMQIGRLLADTAFKIKVKNRSDNEIEIKLPSEFGEELFMGILRGDDEYKSDNDNFIKTFPGLAVVPDDDSRCMYGFNLSDSACMIRVYYHITTTFKDNKTMIFKTNTYNSFYSMTNDKSKLPSDFTTKSEPIPSVQTENMGVLMSGNTPIYARLEFPDLNELLGLGQIVKIQKATLYVRPVKNSYDTVPLPPRLNMYYFDPTSNSSMGGAIRAPSSGGNSGAQYGNLPENYQNIISPDFPQYKFDVTEFISNQLGKIGYDKWALCIVIPPAQNERTTQSQFSESSIQRLVFGNQDFWYKTENQSKDNQVKLEVFYEVYND